VKTGGPLTATRSGGIRFGVTETNAPTPHAQLTSAREGVLLLRRPIIELEPLHVRGKDRVQWLNGMVTSDVAKLPVGSAQFSLHVGKTGKIVSELWIVNAQSELVVGVPRGRAEELAAALDRYLIMEQAEIVAGQPDAQFVLALGPGSSRVVEMARAAGLGAGGARRAGLAVGVVYGDPAAVDAFVTAITGGSGARRDNDGASVADAVFEATAEGWERVRVELGIGKLGVDFDESAYPQEASLEADAVSFSKGCYLGQEAVFMMQERGHPQRRLVQLVVSGSSSDGAAGPGSAVATADGAEVGKITSSADAVSGDATTTLATLKWKHAKGETALLVNGRGAKVTGLAAKG